MVVAYISGRKWGNQLYNYYRPRLHYVLPYIRRQYRPVVGTSLQTVESVDDINAKKKFDLESVNEHTLFTVLTHDIIIIIIIRLWNL